MAVLAGERISVTVSQADAPLNEDDQSLVQMVVTAMDDVNGQIVAPKIIKTVVPKHPKHVIQALPATISARPAQRTPIPMLFLAVDWTQQKFFGSQGGRPAAARPARCQCSKAGVTKPV